MAAPAAIESDTRPGKRPFLGVDDSQKFWCSRDSVLRKQKVREAAVIESPCSSLASVCQRRGPAQRPNDRRFWLAG
jgi:hypothetical protein